MIKKMIKKNTYIYWYEEGDRRESACDAEGLRKPSRRTDQVRGRRAEGTKKLGERRSRDGAPQEPWGPRPGGIRKSQQERESKGEQRTGGKGDA